MTTDFSVQRRPAALSWTFIREHRLDLVLLLITLTIAVIPYRYLWQRGFTDSDDFEEVDRAISLDAVQPSQIFLTPHESNRYRPLDRALNAATAYLFGIKPTAYLLRNLAFHLINSALLFAIVYLLFRNSFLAAAAGSLFAVHPANVNAVGIAVFTQSFSTTLLLLGLLIFVSHLSAPSAASDWRPIAVALLFVGLTFSNEMFLWVGPIYILVSMWAYYARGKRVEYLFALGAMIGGMLLYLLLRQSIVEATAIAAQADDSRYGLRTPVQIARNVGMFLVSSSVVVDYLHFIDPAVETLPITLDHMPSTGMAAAIGCALLISLSTIAGAALGLRRAASRNMRIAALFVGLFFASIAIVNLMTTASETHTYPSNALLVIAQAALLRELASNNRNRSRSFRMAGLCGLVSLLIICRAIGVEYRNAVLQWKAEWVAAVQSQAQQSDKALGHDQLVFVLTCDIPAGYSVYGLNHLELLSTRSFITMTFGSLSPRTLTISYEQFKSNPDLAKATARAVMVDAYGRMQLGTGSPKRPACPL